MITIIFPVLHLSTEFLCKFLIKTIPCKTGGLISPLYHSMHVTSFKKNPMGGYFIKGYINNDKNYDFDATIFSSHSTQFKGDIGYDDKTLGKLFISDDPKNDLSPNEIIKKEHLDKDKYEAEPPSFFFF